MDASSKLAPRSAALEAYAFREVGGRLQSTTWVERMAFLGGMLGEARHDSPTQALAVLEQLPADLREAIAKDLGSDLARRYFAEWPIERGGHLFRAVGGPLFSKYWINMGSRWGNSGVGSREGQLRAYAAQTKVFETIHNLTLLGLTVQAARGKYSVRTAALIGFVTSAYPSISIRHHRHRVERVLETRAQRAKAAQP